MIIWLASYPKSGNTWLRVFFSNLNSGSPAPVDINRLGMTNFDHRPMFDAALGWETTDLTGAEVDGVRPAVQERQAASATLVLKAHEAYYHPISRAPLFSARAAFGALYVIRNPLDVAVSLASHLGRPIDAAIELMNLEDGHLKADDQIPQPMGSWSWHVRSWTELSRAKVHVLRYEDMLADPVETFTAACRFAEFGDDPDMVARAVEHSSFEVLNRQETAAGFREAPGEGRFFRSGKAGGWRESLTERQVEALILPHREMMQRYGYLGDDGSPL